MDQSTWQHWRDKHDAQWREPHGWLSLVSLDWLGAEPQQLQHFPGSWSAVGDLVTATFDSEDDVKRDGVPVANLVQVRIATDASDFSLLDSQGRVAEIASRYGKICVRVRDPRSPVLAAYQGIDTFDFDPDWAVLGEWQPYPMPRQIFVPSAQPGERLAQTAWGEAVFPRLGHARPVVITGESLDELVLIFTDATNGDLTEAWRYAPALVHHDGSITVDFNQSNNFPAHFTLFGTCPTAPIQNDFSNAITAGEKRNRL